MDNGDGIVLAGSGPIQEEREADNERGTILKSFIFRCLHNYLGESVWAGSCGKFTESGAGIIVLGIR
jgi:hypothetical protein